MKTILEFVFPKYIPTPRELNIFKNSLNSQLFKNSFENYLSKYFLKYHKFSARVGHFKNILEEPCFKTFPKVF